MSEVVAWRYRVHPDRLPSSQWKLSDDERFINTLKEDLIWEIQNLVVRGGGEPSKEYKYIEYIQNNGYSYIERNLHGEVSTVWAVKTGQGTDDTNVLNALAQAINRANNGDTGSKS